MIMIYLMNILNKIYRIAFYSWQSKIIFLLGIICFILLTIKYFSIKLTLGLILLFYLIMHKTNCNIYGNCYYSVYTNFILVLIITAFVVADYIGVFNNFKKTVRTVYSFYERQNSSGLKNILYSEDNEVSDYYRNQIYPYLNNKKYDKKLLKKELEEDRNNALILNSNFENTKNEYSNKLNNIKNKYIT